MKIDYLLKRENFYEILEKTLNHYYKDIVHGNVTVKVENKKLSNAVVVYPKLNRIVRRSPSKQIISAVYRGFNINDNPVKRICAKLYITLLLHSKGLFASKSIFFSDLSVFTPLHEICAGNKKIRINDRKCMMSDVIMKSGFPDDYFRSEMEFRLHHKAEYLVPILTYGDDWYRERLVEGFSLARVTDPVLYSSSLQKAMQYLGEMVTQSKHYVSGAVYAETLRCEITNNMEKLFRIKKDIDFDHTAAEELTAKLTEQVAAIEIIPIAISHGDFQTGNIIVDRQKNVYLVDWETYKERSIWYDAVTVKLFTRRYSGWKHILANKAKPEIAEAIYSFDDNREYSINQILTVLLLEDLSFILTDTLMVPGELGCGSINNYISEVINEVST